MVANAFHSFVIGVDFDNTLADYDDLFHTLAVEAGLTALVGPNNIGECKPSLELRIWHT